MFAVDRLGPEMRQALDWVAEHSDREKYFNQQQYRYTMILSRIARYGRGRKVKVLDVGAAPGHIALALARAGYDSHGIVFDLHEDWESTSASERRFAAQVNNSALTLAQCDIQTESFPYADNSFDIVIFTEVLEHLWMFPGHVLAEIHRVLKPCGYLLLSTPNATSLKNRVSWVLGKTSYTSLATMLSLPIHMRHNREYTKIELEQLLANYGFRVVENGYHQWFMWVTRKSGRHAYEDGFRANSRGQLTKLLLLPIFILLPWTRGGLIAVGQKA